MHSVDSEDNNIDLFRSGSRRDWIFETASQRCQI